MRTYGTERLIGIGFLVLAAILVGDAYAVGYDAGGPPGQGRLLPLPTVRLAHQNTSVTELPGSAVVPASISIPAIGVDAGVVRLGLAADGTLQAPTTYDQVGWYGDGSAPGQAGPAVLAGHLDSATGPAVFWRLAALAVGDQVTVTSTSGAVITFTVTAVDRYAKDSFPTAAVYGATPQPQLRLITCGGSFDRTTKHYRDNTIVYATASS